MQGDADSRLGSDGADLTRLYRERFDDRDLAQKRALWDTLCRHFLQRFIDPDATVLDLGAGSCEFTNAVRAGRRIAVDLNPDTKAFAQDAEVHIVPSTDMRPVESDSVDVVFTSNFFEHLPDKDALLGTLVESHRVLRPGGRLIVLMPNIRYLPGRYWDFLDHHLPLTHVSLVEALRLTGFEPVKVIPRFLPYTVKDARVTIPPALIALYLHFPPAWRVLGKQMFVVAVAVDGAGA